MSHILDKNLYQIAKMEGYKFKSDIYRPNIRVSKTTPKTFSELSEKEIKKARIEKAKTGRVKRF